MARTNNVMDEILVETLLSESDPAQPGTSVENAEVDQPQTKRPRISGKSGAASKTKPIHADNGDAEIGAKNTLDELNQKVSQLTEIINSFAPVVKELKGAYDAAQQQDSPSLYEEEPDDGSPSDETGASNLSTLADSRGNDLVDHLVHEVTDDEPTDQALPEKISTVLNNILASGLNEQALTKRKEGVKRPENCNLLRVTKVNSEIWDIARKTTRSMDARLQKLQEALVKGLIPIARLAGIVGESLCKDPKNFTLSPKELWDSLTTSTLLTASANHDLSMCRRDLFKADLDENYKAICSNKEPVAVELFGDDLTERLKTVKESKKAAQQLTSQKRKRVENHASSTVAPLIFYSGAGAASSRVGGPRGKIISHKQRIWDENL